MTHKFKALGLALVAVFAMSAVVASAASALPIHTFTVTGGGSAILEGEQEEGGKNIFTIGSATEDKVECNVAKFSGTVTNGAKEITINPKYEGCSNSVLGTVTVDTAGCDYLFTGETTTTGMADVHINCEGTHHIELTSSVCNIKIKAPQTLNGVGYTAKGTGSTADVTVEATVTMQIQYEKSGSFCFLLGGNGSDGNYTGSVTVKGFEDKSGVKGNQIGIGFTTDP